MTDSLISIHILPVFGPMKVPAVTVEDVERFLNHGIRPVLLNCHQTPPEPVMAAH